MIDIEIAKKINALLSRYIGKRLSDQEKAKDKKWQRRFANEDKFSGVVTDNLRMYFYKDSILSKYIYNGFEEDEISFLKKYLKKGDVFIDIGANIGLFSLHAARIVGDKGRVISFEPTPQTFQRLNENIILNKLQDIVVSNNVGLSNANGNLKLNISSNGHDAWNTFAGSVVGTHHKQIDVPVVTLDYYLGSNNIDVSTITLIKIDVEGWEVSVLNGGMNYLKNNKSATLMIEFTESNAFVAGSSCWELYDLVVSYGYEMFIYDAKENTLKPDKKRLHYPYNNLIATKDVEGVKNRLAQNSR